MADEQNSKENKGLSKREKRALAKEKQKKERIRQQRISKFKNWFIGLLVIIGLLYGGYRLINWINTPVSQEISESIEVTQDDWIKGPETAEATLIEFADFQCPACRTYAPLVNRLSSEFPESLRVVYKHYPLISIHGNAFDAAKAAEAAGMQGEFWEMHDLLFENQDDWANTGNPKDNFTSYAEELDLDLEKFENDYDSGAAEESVQNDMALGRQLGINSTPSFVLNEELVNHPRTYDEFKALIETELQSK